MLLTEWLPIYVSRKLDLEPTTVGTYRAAVNKFSRWKEEKTGGPLDTSEITVDLVSDWLSDLKDVERLRPRSINSYRSSINAVWTGAMRFRQSPATDARLVPSCRIPKTIPVAWSIEELTLLVDTYLFKSEIKQVFVQFETFMLSRF